MTVKNNSMPVSGNKKMSAMLRSARWDLNLYVAGNSVKSAVALENLKQICHDQLKTKFRITVIDVTTHPKSARDAQIVALPTLVRKLPLPEKNIIGDLSNEKQVLIGLEIPSHLPV